VQWCRGLDGRVDPARIVTEARRIADFDVLCLQEVAANFPELPGSGGENQFELLAALLPGYTAVPGAAIDVLGENGRRQVFGNMIFSRYPVLRVARFQLPSPHDPAHSYMPRMLLDTTLDTPLGLVRMMTTHLEYYSARQRVAQVEALRSRHAEACGHARGQVAEDAVGPFHARAQPCSAILTADFNFSTTDPLYQRLQAPFEAATRFVDTWTHCHGDAPRPPTLGCHDRQRWPEPFACDFIFATENLLPRLRDVIIDVESRASDHQPVLAVFA
jgi:endonuclease/exonuclease/phosphatase family metal-dependent hydrolase